MSIQPETRVQVDDLYFETDDAEGLGLRNGAPFEPEVTAALKRLIEPGMTVLDIGANVGYFSACMSRLGRVNTNGNSNDYGGQFRAWRSHPSNSPRSSIACPNSVATSA